jgi:hypothetical protein
MSKDPLRVPTWRVSWVERNSLKAQDGQRDVVASNVVEALEECQPLPLDAQRVMISILRVPKGWVW